MLLSATTNCVAVRGQILEAWSADIDPEHSALDKDNQLDSSFDDRCKLFGVVSMIVLTNSFCIKHEMTRFKTQLNHVEF